MEFLTTLWAAEDLSWLEQWIDDWVFVIAAALFVIELLRYAIKKRFSTDLALDSVCNFATLAMFFVIGSLAFAAYISLFFWVYNEFSVIQLPITPWTVLCCLVLADLAYYWEHRFLHKNGLAWATHTVHHSSPHFNISVAYRHGPMDWFYPFFFHIPLAFLGFHPLMIFFCEKVVQLFQTLLHTETVGKFPRFIEAIFNTPSHHRVHHATNKQYLDRNYAGILIIWDRMFGTFAEEKEEVRYGVFPRINSNNPLKVFFSGYVKLAKQVWEAPSWSYRWNLLNKPPIWAWQNPPVKPVKDKPRVKVSSA